MFLKRWLPRLPLQPAKRFGDIGLDLGPEQAHLVQLERHAGSLRARSAISLGYPTPPDRLLESPKELARFVRTAVERGRLRGRRVVTAMPPGAVRLMVLNYQLDPDVAEPERILRLARERVRESLDECVVDYVSIRTSGGEQGDRSALVAVAEEAAVIRHLERLRCAGLEVDALEIPPVAVRRLIAWTQRDHLDNAALALHITWERTALTVLWGRRLLLYREVEIGVSHIIDRLCKSLDLEPEAASELLAEYGVLGDGGVGGDEGGEISATLREVVVPCFQELANHAQKAISYTAFQARGTSIERAYALGSAVVWPGFTGMLQALLAIPVVALDPLPGLSAELGSPSRPFRLAIATGHALRGLFDE